MTFSVDENVLIPRQDTETLVERVLRDYPEKDLKLLDMCTGSGCIAISLAVLGGYQVDIFVYSSSSCLDSLQSTKSHSIVVAEYNIDLVAVLGQSVSSDLLTLCLIPITTLLGQLFNLYASCL